VLVYAVSDTAGEPDRPVLDWRFSALQFYSQEPNDARKLCRSTGSTIDHSTHDPLMSPSAAGARNVAAYVLFCTARNRRP
jgi:hypothetical protein